MSRPMTTSSPAGSVAAMPVRESDPQHIRSVFEAQLTTALAWRESTAKERIARIKRLREVMLKHQQAIYDAFFQDYRKSSAEVDIVEILPVLDEARHAIGSLKRWMKPTGVWPTMATVGTRARIEYQPRGRVLIIAPWNYPLNLLLGPLVSALAAGNTAMLKPSEMNPAVSAVLARIIREAFPENEVAILEGGLPTSQALLELPFDHIFFTGSPAVGKVVMAAAAKHLTSVTLELGGKSPTIVDETADLQKTAETLMWGKFINGGQTCVAPDYVYVHESVKEALIERCKQVIAQRFGATAAEQKRTEDLTRVINERHTQRLDRLLQDALRRGARVRAGGEVDLTQHYVAPTLIDQVPAEAQLMEEEIFGPVLPLVGYTDLDAVIRDINARPKALALYIFSRNEANIRNVLTRTSSGGACVNHCVLHFAHGNLPFGGVNNSGIGSGHGYAGFKAFSHERAVLRSTPLHMVRMFFPPYTKNRRFIIRMVVDSLKLPSL